MSSCPLPPPLEPPPLETLLKRNVAWADAVAKYDGEFFPQLANNPQKPPVLWIGCVDSRVPESVITNCRPGDIFVHRNIANLFTVNDDCAESVLAYAVESLGVQHIVVCGHTDCGGVNTAYRSVYPDTEPEARSSEGPEEETIKCLDQGKQHLDRWLEPIVELANNSDFAPGTATAMGDPIQRLVEANVRQQMKNILESKVFKEQKEQLTSDSKAQVDIHGWVFDLATGKLKDLND